MKVYLAGKITGNPEYKEKFASAEHQLSSYGNIVSTLLFYHPDLNKSNT